ncbi:DUF805 domain-containing protein [Brevundimonas faecalis]|uniref:Uncharacterized membrane protein YhaH (DUF805 family) n=1 Tax=Brevundimonas faecalis TaxID=947378 RepID=A0ABV2R9Y6_9CAUL
MNSRAGRQEWWLWFFGANVGGARLEEALSAAILGEKQTLADASLLQTASLAVGVTTIMAVVIGIQMSATVRRAHDLDSPSWVFWGYALLNLSYAASGFIPSALNLPPPFNPAWAHGLLIVANVVMAVLFGFRSGDPKRNRWGPPPKPLFDFMSPRQDNYRPPVQ